jgi:hypothetical protein
MDAAAVIGVTGLVTTLVAALASPMLAARAQNKVRSLDELRGAIDIAAGLLATAEASGRRAWRVLLDIDFHSDTELDEAVRDVQSDAQFPSEDILARPERSNSSWQTWRHFGLHRPASTLGWDLATRSPRLSVERAKRWDPPRRRCRSVPQGQSARAVQTSRTHSRNSSAGSRSLERSSRLQRMRCPRRESA